MKKKALSNIIRYITRITPQQSMSKYVSNLPMNLPGIPYTRKYAISKKFKSLQKTATQKPSSIVLNPKTINNILLYYQNLRNQLITALNIPLESARQIAYSKTLDVLMQKLQEQFKGINEYTAYSYAKNILKALYNQGNLLVQYSPNNQFIQQVLKKYNIDPTKVLPKSEYAPTTQKGQTSPSGNTGVSIITGLGLGSLGTYLLGNLLNNDNKNQNLMDTILLLQQLSNTTPNTPHSRPTTISNMPFILYGSY
ncbi:MAG: hypothetical protein QXH92_04035 [Candidatus Aenigmatarchaeota archaeon]